LLAGGFVVPDLKPLTTSWLHSRRSAAPTTLANLPFYRLYYQITLIVFLFIF